MDYHKNAPWVAISREQLARMAISPLHQPRSSLTHNQQNEHSSSTDGELPKYNLSHLRGAPQRDVNTRHPNSVA